MVSLQNSVPDSTKQAVRRLINRHVGLVHNTPLRSSEEWKRILGHKLK